MIQRARYFLLQEGLLPAFKFWMFQHRVINVESRIPKVVTSLSKFWVQLHRVLKIPIIKVLNLNTSSLYWHSTCLLPICLFKLLPLLEKDPQTTQGRNNLTRGFLDLLYLASDALSTKLLRYLINSADIVGWHKCRCKCSRCCSELQI